MSNILFFSPFQGIAQHAFIERKFGHLLKNMGHEVEFLTCDGIFERACLSFAVYGVKSSDPLHMKRSVCDSCRNYRAQLESLNLKTSNIENYLSPSALQEVERFIDEIKVSRHVDCEYDAYAVGRIASYEMILNNKIKNVAVLGEAFFEEFLENLRNVMVVLKAITHFFDTKKVDQVFVYNSNYSVNNIVSAVAKRRNIRLTSMQYPVNLETFMSTMVLTDENTYLNLRSRVEFFAKHHDKINVSASDIQTARNHIQKIHSASSPWVYSAPKHESQGSVQRKMGVDRTRPIYLLSMSSPDELFGLNYAIFNSHFFDRKTPVFRDQIAWIEETVSYFKKHPELQLIIRVHPREFPNKRESVKADVSQYDRIFSEISDNIHINTPDDNISIYDLFDIINVNIVGWSSVGMESVLAGIPTISTFDMLTTYPSEALNYTIGSVDEYHHVLSTSKDMSEVECDRLKNLALKWLAFDLNYSALKFKGGEFWNRQNSLFDRVLNKLRRILVRFGIKLSTHEYSYSAYSSQFEISQAEMEILGQYISQAQPIHKLKVKLG